VQGRACGEDPVLELRLERDIADDFMRLFYGPFSERKLAAGLGSLSSSAAKLRDASDRALQGQWNSTRRLSTARANCAFEFDKRSQLFIRANNEAPTVAAIRIKNEDCSPARILGWDAAPTPTGFAEIVSDAAEVFLTAIQLRICSYEHEPASPSKTLAAPYPPTATQAT
jgi:hypothetical protein